MSNDALIGYTGFVGSTLARGRSFSGLFNSRNIEDIRGQSFDQVVCAGVSAVKWLANKEPAQDWDGISRLIAALKSIRTQSFVLVSTIDVYGDPNGQTELDAPATEGLHPYGLHRLRLEEFVAETFENHTILRLPALFGTGLKKNAIFDLIHRNQPEKIVPNAKFQWYPLRRLSEDLEKVTAAGIRLANITTEPVEMESIRRRFFPAVKIADPVPTPPFYNLRTIHDSLLGGAGGYHLSSDQVMSEISDFLASEAAS